MPGEDPDEGAGGGESGASREEPPDRPGRDHRDRSARSREGSRRNEPGASEVYCYDCGSVISENAEICPDCGVRQREPPADRRGAPRQGHREPAPGPQGLPVDRQRSLEKTANKDLPSTILLSIFTPFFAYIEVGKPGYAILNLLTANYLMLGLLVVPLHTRSTIASAREQLRTAGVEGY